MIIYDMATKQAEMLVSCILRLSTGANRYYFRSIQFSGELTSVRISCDSKYALVNHAPDVRLFCSSMFCTASIILF
jgi:hypothetical protein